MSHAGGPRWPKPVQVIIVGSVMFTFISYWRTAAVVLCDLASTAFYIGGIVEQAIGPAAPWFILAVMLFSMAVCSLYIESCSLFVRGGVYRVVKSALGGFFAKLSVSALLFDFILTGPISSVSAGQYVMGLFLEMFAIVSPELAVQDEASRKLVKSMGAMVIAALITLYFFRKNLIGIHESSDKALKIMIATTIMAVVMLTWSGITLAVRAQEGKINDIPHEPNLAKRVEHKVAPAMDPITGESKDMWVKGPAPGEFVPATDEEGRPKPKLNPITGRQEDPLGFLGRLFPGFADSLRTPGSWLSLLGLLGLMIAFGHSVLAMSGEETLAQVYREVESPKLPNFKKAALVVFVYSLLLTGGISFLAVLIIPDGVRMKDYSENLIGGLAMYMVGPLPLRLLLNAFVVITGTLILSGAVNTSIIGASGVLNRVAEDGVLPAWLQKPHRRYGTTHRVLYVIVALQLVAIAVTHGDTILLGEAYAFGVVWSFVFMAVSMVVLRFKDSTPCQFKVPFNIRIGQVEIPIGLGIIALILVGAAVSNFFTKEVATVAGVVFTGLFLTIFLATERYYAWRRRGAKHEHLEQFTQETTEDEVSPAALGLVNTYRKLVAIRSPQNLFMLDKALEETDPDTTDLIVMTAKVAPTGGIDESLVPYRDLDPYDQQLMTAVVQHAERAGKEVKPLIVPTNNPLFAVTRTAKQLHVQELIVGASNKFTAEEQLDQMALYWIDMHGGEPAPLTMRILGRKHDVYFDLAGGSRIPKISERKARSVAELRAAGVGVDRVLLVHNGTPESSDLFKAVLTMLDPQVSLALVRAGTQPSSTTNGSDSLQLDQEQAQQLDRDLEVLTFSGDFGPEIVRLAREGKFDLIILTTSPEPDSGQALPSDDDVDFVLRHAPCRVFLAAPPAIPQEPEEQPPRKS